MVDQLQIDQKSTNANNNYLADGSIGGSNILIVNNYSIKIICFHIFIK